MISVHTMYNHDTTVSQLFLMNSLSIDESLVEESAEGGSLVETNDAIIGLDFLQRS